METVGKKTDTSISSLNKTSGPPSLTFDVTKKFAKKPPSIAQTPFTPFTKAGRKALDKEREPSDTQEFPAQTRRPGQRKLHSRSLSTQPVVTTTTSSKSPAPVLNPPTESVVTKEDREVVSSADLPKWEGTSSLLPYLFRSDPSFTATQRGATTTSAGMSMAETTVRVAQTIKGQQSRSLLSNFSVPSEENLFPKTTPPRLIEHARSTVSATHASSEQLWDRIVSSAARRIPSTREESELLEKWVDCEILRLKVVQDITRKEYYRRLQRILARAFQEVIRQVTSTCTERGRLLTHLWMLYVSVFEVCYSDFIKT